MAGTFTTIWIEFRTVDLCQAYYLATEFPSRISPQCERSVDIVYPNSYVPTAELWTIPGVIKRPQMFVLGYDDPLPFLTAAQRRLEPAA